MEGFEDICWSPEYCGMIGSHFKSMRRNAAQHFRPVKTIWLEVAGRLGSARSTPCLPIEGTVKSIEKRLECFVKLIFKNFISVEGIVIGMKSFVKLMSKNFISGCGDFLNQGYSWRPTFLRLTLSQKHAEQRLLPLPPQYSRPCSGKHSPLASSHSQYSPYAPSCKIQRTYPRPCSGKHSPLASSHSQYSPYAPSCKIQRWNS